MINTELYTLIDCQGFKDKSDAYDTIRMCYEGISGVTVYYDDGLWFIVQSNALK